MPDFDLGDIAENLNGDGDSYEIPTDNGTWTFRLRIVNDELSYEDMEDPEVFGKIAPIDSRGRSWYDKQYHVGRPPEFTGAARIQWSESAQGDRWWYEPPAEFRTFKGSSYDTVPEWTAACEAHARNVRTLISWGYIYVEITAEHRLPDGYHREFVNSLGGIEAEGDRAYLDACYHQVLSELLLEIA